MLLSCQTLDVLYAFYIFFGTNLLTQCQVPVPVFFRVFDPFQRRILNGVQTEYNLRKDFFSGTEDTQGAWEPRQRAPGEATSPLGTASGAAPSRLVGPVWLVCPTSSAYKSLKKSKTTGEIHENTFPPPQASVSARSHLGHVLVPCRRRDSVTEGFFINTIASPMMRE